MLLFVQELGDKLTMHLLYKQDELLDYILLTLLAFTKLNMFCLGYKAYDKKKL